MLGHGGGEDLAFFVADESFSAAGSDVDAEQMRHGTHCWERSAGTQAVTIKQATWIHSGTESTEDTEDTDKMSGYMRTPRLQCLRHEVFLRRIRRAGISDSGQIVRVRSTDAVHHTIW